MREPPLPGGEPEGGAETEDAVSDSDDALLLGGSRLAGASATEQHVPSIRKPWFVWPLLALGVCAVASAGVVFDTMPDVPALLLAAWRLQLTALLLSPGAIIQFLRLEKQRQQAVLRSSWLLGLSGVCLAFHFGCWVWGIKHTSLAHSLLLVSATPALLAIGTICMCKPISPGEIFGTLVAIAGASVLSYGSSTAGVGKKSISWQGDLASLGGAAAMVGYLSAGAKLRGASMPLFVYATPVTATAAVLLTVASVAMEHTAVLGNGAHGAVGWLFSKYWWKVLYLATGPGLLGHTGFNFLLRWLAPLVVSLALTLEPLAGSLLGWALGVTQAPTPLECLGGFMLMAAMAVVTISSHRRESKKAAEAPAEVEGLHYDSPSPQPSSDYVTQSDLEMPSLSR